MARNAPNPIDVHVGSRVRLRRLVVEMSQEKLVEQLGITFQQVQKYEKGTNRIGASRLYTIAQILGVPVGFFYEGLTGAERPGFAETQTERYVVDFISSSDGVQLTKAFLRIADPQVRRRIIELVQALADQKKE